MTPIRIRLREAREARGLTQAALAGKAGVRRATVIAMENHQTGAIDFAVWEKLAKALEMDPALLVTTEPAAPRKSRRKT